MFCVPVFAWMSLKEILRGRLDCFFFARLRASPVRKGVIMVFPFRAVFHYLFYFGMRVMRVQTRNVFQPACQPYFKLKPNTVFFDVS